MAVKSGLRKKTKPYKKDEDSKTKLFYLFLIAQICALFGLVVGIVFFILRFFKSIG